MSKLIEVEIENKSYLELLNLEHQQTNKLKLTTLIDNQAAVIIKIFLNKSDTRIQIKEFKIRNLKPRMSGLERFELISSYSHKILHLKLKVDGKEFETSEIKLVSYLRNKFLPLFIILGAILAFLLFTGGRWLFSSFVISNNTDFQTSINKPETVIIKKELPSPSIIEREPAKQEKTPAIEEKITTMQEVTKPVPKPVREIVTSMRTLYFTPDNTSIQKDTALVLKDLAKELITLSNIKVEISGYCAMTGTEEGRKRLSKERAYNVFAYLNSEGWIPETEPVIKWFGGTQPVTYDQNKIYMNRRVEISIVSQ